MLKAPGIDLNDLTESSSEEPSANIRNDFGQIRLLAPKLRRNKSIEIAGIFVEKRLRI
jgi:hypothetical protein